MSGENPKITAAKELLELCPDFPKPGVMFKNLFPVLRNPAVFQGLMDVLENIRTRYPSVEVIVGLDSRGFLFGPMIALALGVAFVPAAIRNLFPVLRNPVVFQGLIDVLVEDIRTRYPSVEVIVGLDSRGFLFGPMIAVALGVAFVPVRKKGKLPGEKIQQSYELEYGTDTCEIQKNSIQPGQKVVIVDDLLATGGTMKAACDLMEGAKAEVLACMVVIELKFLKGKDKLKYPLLSYMD